MLLIVGLGNPGKEYLKTNHNVGFRVLDKVADHLGVNFEKKIVGQAQIATYGVGENRVVLAKPQNYMNNSGLSVNELVNKYKIDHKTQLVVVADDFDVTEGTIRIRNKSGNTTHNGIKSIKNELGTNEFIRVKVSIAPRPEFVPIADFVLSRSTNKNIEKSEDLAKNAIVDLIQGASLDEISRKYSS